MAKKASFKTQSKWFRIATEGDTTDGRKIEASWLEQMAANYDPKKYGARVNCEHIRGLAPDGDFGAFGDVAALKLSSVEIDGEERTALMAQITPNDDLIALSKRRKKVYTSMEIDPDFTQSGEAYLIGLAITDSPASLGTEMLEFAASAKHNPLADKKQRPENLFSAAHEVTLEFEDGQTLVEKVRALFTAEKTDRSAKDSEIAEALEVLAHELADVKTQFNALQKPDPTALTQLQEQLTSTKNELDDLKQQLSETPNTQFKKRPAATGGNSSAIVTDC